MSSLDAGQASSPRGDAGSSDGAHLGAIDGGGDAPAIDGAPSAEAGGSPEAEAGPGGDGGGAGEDGGGDGSMPVSATCTDPAYVLPLNPSNPQDGVTLSGFYVDTDTWNVANYAVSQTMYICDYDNWYVVANMNNDTGDGAVKTYPDVHMDFSSAPALGSFTSISSSFAHAGPHVGIYEFAYDMWLNGVATSGSTEVMIWTDNFNQVPSGSKVETVSLKGQTFDVYKSGSYIAFVATANVTSGSLDLLSFFDHVLSEGWAPSTSTLGAIDYGIEIVSTGSADATFRLDAFSLTTE
jgi:Glycosyl hydrolase family 12